MNTLAALSDLNVVAHDYTFDASFGMYEVHLCRETGRGWWRHLQNRSNSLFDLKQRDLPPEVEMGLVKVGLR